MARTPPSPPLGGSGALVAAARRAGVVDTRVLEALGEVDRARFLPRAARSQADRDRPIGIGGGQTTSQPSLIARMIEVLALTPTSRVLEVGTGSGYQTALLARLAGEVVSIERDASLAAAAARRLRDLDNVTVVVGDGSLGWQDRAPYDAITVGACAPGIPEALLAQLAADGVLVLPVRDGDAEVLTTVRKAGGRVGRPESGLEVRFVPLVGEAGFAG